MTFSERLCLLAFGLFGWSVSMFVAADPDTVPVLVEIAAVQSGIGAGLFVAGLLPGRTVRFS